MHSTLPRAMQAQSAADEDGRNEGRRIVIAQEHVARIEASRGVVYIHAEAGRAVRSTAAAVAASDVLECSGDVRAGDTVHVVVRGNDGGQGVVATGIVQCGAVALRMAAAGSVGAPRCIVVAEMRLLWPRKQ